MSCAKSSSGVLSRLRKTGLSLKDIDYYYQRDTGNSIYTDISAKGFLAWAEEFLEIVEDCD